MEIRRERPWTLMGTGAGSLLAVLLLLSLLGGGFVAVPIFVVVLIPILLLVARQWGRPASTP